MFTIGYMKENPDMYKFVVVNKKFRFTHNDEYHCSLVKEGEVASAAGTFLVKKDRIAMWDLYSSSLNVGCSEEAENQLGKLFGLPVTGKYS